MDSRLSSDVGRNRLEKLSWQRWQPPLLSRHAKRPLRAPPLSGAKHGLDPGVLSSIGKEAFASCRQGDLARKTAAVVRQSGVRSEMKQRLHHRCLPCLGRDVQRRESGAHGIQAGAVHEKERDQLRLPTGNRGTQPIRSACTVLQEMLARVHGSGRAPHLHSQDDGKLVARLVHSHACFEEKCYGSRVLSPDGCVQCAVGVVRTRAAAATVRSDCKRQAQLVHGLAGGGLSDFAEVFSLLRAGRSWRWNEVKVLLAAPGRVRPR